MFPLLLLLGATLLSGQGVPAEWNTRQQLDDLKAKFEAIGPELSRVDLKRWRETGVPEAYLSQFESIQSQLKSLTLAVADLRQAPEKMSVALEIFLRFDALDSMQRPVMEAIRKYEQQELADAIEAKFVDSAPGRTNFRNYLLDLASLRDREYDVLLAEAQRCRIEKNSPAPTRPAAAPAKKK